MGGGGGLGEGRGVGKKNGSAADWSNMLHAPRGYNYGGWGRGRGRGREAGSEEEGKMGRKVGLEWGAVKCRGEDKSGL